MLLIVSLVAGVFAVVGESGDDDPSAATASATTEPPAPSGPEEIFGAADGVLEDSGQFSYEFTGRWESDDPLEAGRTQVLQFTGSGKVRLPDEANLAVEGDDGRRLDVVIMGGTLWQRATAFPDQIEQRPWAELPVEEQFESGGFDATDLPDWFDATTDHRDGGEDANGRTVVRAAVPSSAMSPAALGVFVPEEQILSSELELTVDDQHAPVRVVVSATTQSTVVELTLDRIDVASAVTIDAPSSGELDETPFVDQEDIAVVQGAETLGLAGVPAGWFLVGGSVVPDPVDPGCAAVTLFYLGLGGQVDPVTGPENYLFLNMAPLACEVDASLFDDPNFSAGGYEGFASEASDGNFGAVQVGETVVGFGSGLPLSDLSVVLATLGVVDLAAEPEAIEGIPSEPA